MLTKIKKFVLVALASLLMASMLVTCGSRDDRDDVRAELGEPDIREQLGRDQFWREIWVYCGDPGLGIEFRRSAGCGPVQDIFIFRQFPAVCDTATDSTAVFTPKSLDPFSPIR